MRGWFTLWLGLVFSSVAMAADAPVRLEAQPNLTILVDENLLLPTALLSRHYSSLTNTPLTVVAKSATDAERQIEQGLEAHILLTANQRQIERLAGQGLMDVSSTRPFARTQLALVATRDFDKKDVLAKRISFAALIAATPELPVFINDPSTPEGERSAALLNGNGFSEALAARVQVKGSRAEIIDAMQETHGLGLLLAADAIGQPDITVISILSPELAPAVTYDAVVLASESMQGAREFTRFLQSRRAKEIFSHFGLQAPQL